MTRVMAGFYAIVIAAFIAASMYLTGSLTASDITGLIGIS